MRQNKKKQLQNVKVIYWLTCFDKYTCPLHYFRERIGRLRSVQVVKIFKIYYLRQYKIIKDISIKQRKQKLQIFFLLGERKSTNSSAEF